MANQEMVRKTPLVELSVVLEIIVLLLVEQVLLSTLWNIVGQQGVTLVELSLVLTHARSVLFLQVTKLDTVNWYLGETKG